MARRLTVAGKTKAGHTIMIAPSASRPGAVNTVLVSQDGTRVSCNCRACQTSGKARKGWRTAARAEVLAGKVHHACFLLKNAARWAPLRVRAKALTSS